jgi:hypothetical protein
MSSNNRPIIINLDYKQSTNIQNLLLSEFIVQARIEVLGLKQLRRKKHYKSIYYVLEVTTTVYKIAPQTLQKLYYYDIKQ